MKSNFEAALAHTLKHEGLFSDHPADPGGATMKGITLAVFRAYKSNQHLTAEDLKRITDDEVRDIYKRKYWDPCRCDDLPPGVDVCVFDCAVNSGVGRSSKFLQECAGVQADGVVGPVTLGVVRKLPPADIVNRMCDKRQTFLESLKTFAVFGKGWTRRVSEVRAFALKMI